MPIDITSASSYACNDLLRNSTLPNPKIQYILEEPKPKKTGRLPPNEIETSNSNSKTEKGIQEMNRGISPCSSIEFEIKGSPFRKMIGQKRLLSSKLLNATARETKSDGSYQTSRILNL